MPQLDRCHEQVVHALQKEGWVINPLPFPIDVPKPRKRLMADIEARRGRNRIIVAEVKCFDSQTPDELYTAFGQYIIYRSLMQKAGVKHPLYLAVPSNAYHGIFREMALEAAAEISMKFIVVQLEMETIEQWIT